MTIFGIGPLLFVAGGSTLAGVLLLQLMVDVRVAFPSPWWQIFFGIGIILCAIGAYFWIGSALLVERAFRRHELVTNGPFRLSRNPLYAAFIVFVMPGVAFIVNNLLILAVSVVTFIVFKLQIGKEEEYLRTEFDEEYPEYEQEVAQLIPFLKI